MNKDEVIILITERIKSEHKKHNDIEWERIAAYKIYASLNKLFNLHIVSNNEAFCEVAVGDTLDCMKCKHWKEQPKGCLGCRRLFSPTDC